MTPDPGDDAADIAGRPGVTLKARPEDFRVEEIPAYEPTGDGEHVYLFIEKRNATTTGVARAIARTLGVPAEKVGFAGLKDRHAITRQWFSVWDPAKRIDDDTIARLDADFMSVLDASRHANKLRRGHLRGNKFSITARGVGIAAAPGALAKLREMRDVGVVNSFGVQRYGSRGNNHRIGRAIILGEHAEALRMALGMTEPADGARADADARRLFEESRFAEALDAFPSSAAPERNMLAALRSGSNPAAAVRAAGRVQRDFWISAYQSAVFDYALAERVAAGRLVSLEAGDLAFKHDSGAVFSVGDSDQEAELERRLAAFEISPSGPMWGPAMKRATARTDADEVAALAASGVTIEQLERHAKRSNDRGLGARRAMRVRVDSPTIEAGADEHGEFVRCGFTLPPGSFATVVMQHVFADSGVAGRPACIAAGGWG